MGLEVKTMELKNGQQKTASAETPINVKKAKEFVADVRSEIQKITWTSREELITYTQIVVSAMFICGMSIYALDLLIQGTLNGLHFLLSFISG